MKALTRDPVARAQMLIRRPPEAVFEAFVDPAVTTRFWFTRSSGRLEVGKQVRWDWEMYGVHADVEVKAIEPNRRIVIEWPSTIGRTRVEWLFTPRAEGTFVTVVNSGFQGAADEKVDQALDSTGGFNIVLCGAKALLEHGVEPNLIADHAPDHLVKGWKG